MRVAQPDLASQLVISLFDSDSGKILSTKGALSHGTQDNE